MIFIQLSTEPAASERERYEKKGVSGFLVEGEVFGKTLSAPLFSLSGFDAALEEVFSSKSEKQSLLRVRPFSIDDFLDRILDERMREAPSDSIKASYRVLLGQVGVSVAKIAFRRLNTALNSARFADLKIPKPILVIDLVEVAPQGVEMTRRYYSECFHSDAAFLLSSRQLPMLEDWDPSGSGLGEGFAEAKGKVDKLANYQIDLDRLGIPC